jgi:uncharacterized protein YecE (DUF72 family)
MKWYIGCSGFQYRGWRPEFYPDNVPQRLWFEFYNEKFKTLELNTTFYSFPKIESLKSWYERSVSDFIFSVKAPRLITHYKKFVDVKSLMLDLYKVLSKGLREKLGPILFQLPPNIQYDKEKLIRIMSQMNNDFINVIEFRHSSWWNQEVYDRLSSNKITFCSISHPVLPRDLIQNTKVVYLRMHGTSKLYTSEYKKETLQKIIQFVKMSGKIKNCYVYFNNDSKGAAYRNAGQMIKMTK